ncbi:MAG: hypothetical protein WED06_00375 [Candidatus Paceibacterota bacterium]
MEQNPKFDVKVFELRRPTGSSDTMSPTARKVIGGKATQEYEAKTSEEVQTEIREWLSKEDPPNIKNPLVVGFNVYIFYEKRFSPQQ